LFLRNSVKFPPLGTTIFSIFKGKKYASRPIWTDFTSAKPPNESLGLRVYWFLLNYQSAVIFFVNCSHECGRLQLLKGMWFIANKTGDQVMTKREKQSRLSNSKDLRTQGAMTESPHAQAWLLCW
jgi:hypothetical protein